MDAIRLKYLYKPEWVMLTGEEDSQVGRVIFLQENKVATTSLNGARKNKKPPCK